MNGRIRSLPDLGIGIFLIAAGAAFLFVGRDLEMGTAFNMGAGYFPRYVSLLAILVGVALIVVAFRFDDALPFRPRLRPLVLITLSMVFFAIALRPLGLFLTAFATVVIASFAGGRPKAFRLLAVAFAMSILVCGIFVYGLGLPIAISPSVN